ncbi:MAG: Mov34/MPN/PAD-1 family protein [Methanobacterium sp.]
MSSIKFKSIDNEFSVEINEIILNNIKKECIKAKNKETGGILIGNYSVDNSNALISNITGPPSDSKQTESKFKLGIMGLNKLLENSWKQGHYYIGEWHFHPNSSPQPSIDDNMQMKKLATDKLLRCPEPILLVLGGNQDKGWKISVNVYKKDRKIPLTKQS